MNKPQYTKEELEIIKKWAIAGDYEMARKGHILGSSKKQITVLDMAMNRKNSVERVRRELENEVYGKVI